MTTVEEPSTVEKFDLLIKDFTCLMDTTKSLSARMKVLQKEVNKSARGKRTRKAPAEVDPDAPKRVSALQKPVSISNELCKFLGFEPDSEHSRQEVTANINSYIKTNDLQDPENRRFIRLDGSEAASNLKILLREPDQPVTFFNIQRYLKPHYPMSEKDKKALAVSAASSSNPTPSPVAKQSVADVVQDVDTVEEATKEVAKPPAKKRVVRRPPSSS
jgi:chromatin remodeling complex protein RSC6